MAPNSEQHFRRGANEKIRRAIKENHIENKSSYVVRMVSKNTGKSIKLETTKRGNTQELFHQFNNDDEPGEKRVDGTVKVYGRPDVFRFSFKTYGGKHQQHCSVQTEKGKFQEKLNRFPDILNYVNRTLDKAEAEGITEWHKGAKYFTNDLITDRALIRHCIFGTDSDNLDMHIIHGDIGDPIEVKFEEGIITLVVHDFFLNDEDILPENSLRITSRYGSGRKLSRGDRVLKEVRCIVTSESYRTSWTQQYKPKKVPKKKLPKRGLDAKKVQELKALCKEKGLKGYSKLKKQQLIDLLNSV